MEIFMTDFTFSISYNNTLQMLTHIGQVYHMFNRGRHITWQFFLIQILLKQLYKEPFPLGIFLNIHWLSCKWNSGSQSKMLGTIIHEKAH